MSSQAKPLEPRAVGASMERAEPRPSLCLLWISALVRLISFSFNRGKATVRQTDVAQTLSMPIGTTRLGAQRKNWARQFCSASDPLARQK